VPTSLRPAATHYFGERLPLAVRYAELLASDGVVRGLIGPREVPRIWERHMLNSVALAERITSGAPVVDVGSGAGLPGVALAIALPDLDVVLVEPQLRRTRFLEEVVQALDLGRVTVVRARADEAVRRVPPADVVVARAVAPLGRLAGWCLPLVVPGGRLLAVKGAAANEEVARDRAVVREAGGSDPVVVACGTGWLDPPTTVVEVTRER
jgi:16S rRNA (guanine527-N7)-methyltransferase